MCNTKTKTDFQGKCLPNMRSRKGGVLIPALFLMVLFIALGGALLSMGQAGAGITTSAVKAHQAYYTAKSALDLFTSSLTGEYVVNAETKEPFKSLNEMLSPMEKGNKISAVGTAAGDANVEITSTDKVIEDLLTTQTFLIEATGICGTAERTLTREITLERKVSGKIEGLCLGTNSGGKKTDYNISGMPSGDSGLNAKIKGGLRVENAKTFNMFNVTIDGDLYICAEGTVVLNDVKVNGNVYIESKNQSVLLYDCYINATNKVASPKTILVSKKQSVQIAEGFHSDGNIYVDAVKFNLPRENNLVKASTIYLANHTKIKGGTPDATLIEDETATSIFMAEYGKVNTSATNITISQPQNEKDYDLVITKLDINKLYKAYPIDVSGGKTVNIYIDAISFALLENLDVTGDGTVNFYVDEAGVFSPNFVVNRKDDAKTIVNFIGTKPNFTFTLPALSGKLDANILAPSGNIYGVNCPVNGVMISSNYLISSTIYNAVLIDTQSPFANTGSLVITNGDETVKGTAGGYGK
ncbi:MAG: hypothetical protein RSC96_07445 [Oscillospiraceae bacterium]